MPNGELAMAGVGVAFPIIIFMKDKLFAVLLAEPIADVVASLVTIMCFSLFYKRTLNNKELSYK
ncbi:putative na+ driven multidrug efflux pump [Clostridium sporogenes]|uniref:hypothetical protein n=1 Tax=Clostridium botulinum TaxID=1491 RepID=UPI00090A4336|nr:hypothetical protein [Clostridium botulinum]APF25724.1 putative na+ driven multidrug efflux pump [Clostridium sporogenes]WMU96002.1 hypothetical protein QA656_09405 [Clostridium botulinum]